MFGVCYTLGGKPVHSLCNFLAATPTLQKSWDETIGLLVGEMFMLGELHNGWIAIHSICLYTHMI